MTRVSRQPKRASKGGEKSTRSYRASGEWFPYLRRVYKMEPRLIVPGVSEKTLDAETRRTRLWKRTVQSQVALQRALSRLRRPFPLLRSVTVIGTSAGHTDTEDLLAPLVADYRPLPREAKEAAQLLGITGRVANLLNAADGERLRWLLDQAGWLAMILYLAAIGQPAETVAEAALLAHLGLTHDWCEHGRHHYLRHTLGRRPEACPLHAKAARQQRWRASPGRQRKQSPARAGARSRHSK